ncbi:MAG: LacI family DNA-binding transcriptional regulator [Verrucomicrobia bacterium]|nr:LacI family DNA-binding transcriptional regulator [Verrucomicrobiota bacterium]
MAEENAHVTQSQVAAAAGVARATVSYVLRDDPKIPSATAARVRAAAERLGYRPNPRVAALMAHIRQARPVGRGERIAFVWVHTTRREAQQNPFLKNVFAGARDRANQIGFTLEEFWTNDPGMTDQRLEQIVRARGIVGVVLSPVTTAEPTITLGWDWRHFAPAVVGNVTWTPELHHAGHHHYLGMRMALLELAKLGCQRPAALIEQGTNERAKRAWEAAFLTHHPRPQEAPRFVRLVGPDGRGETAPWLRTSGADALIVSETALLDAPSLRTVRRQLALPATTLYWSADAPRDLGGIDQCYDRISAHAVDLVAAQLNANETGVPDLPRMMLFPGRWIAPQLAAKRARAGK